MKLLLNTAIFDGEPIFFNENRDFAGHFLGKWGFDGYEIYPVGKCKSSDLPENIIEGVHLRFFPVLAPVWRNDKKRLMEIYGSWETVESHFGGINRQWITDYYADQLDLAEIKGCSYAVFHPVQCEPDYIYSWNFPWSVKDTLDLYCQVINSALDKSFFKGELLFENLWWPGSFTLAETWEYEYLIENINYSRCGITLDTGHMMSTNPHLENEREAAEFINKKIIAMGDIAGEIKNVHLSRSLSGDYILRTRDDAATMDCFMTLDQRLEETYRHISRIDLHDPFEESHIYSVFENIDPHSVVFEFTFSDMAQWEKKISVQKQSLYELLRAGKPVENQDREEVQK